MKGVARISDTGGGVVMPARSPYDRELLLDCLRQRLHRNASVRLELDGRRWSVTLLAGQPLPDCARCQRAARLYGINDARAGGPVCAACLGVLLHALPDVRPRAGAVHFPDDPLPDAAAGGAPPSSATTSSPTVFRQERQPWPRSK
jgi:hypothetical protein